MRPSAVPAGAPAGPRFGVRDRVPAGGRRPGGLGDGGAEGVRPVFAVHVVLPDGECVEELFWPEEAEPARGRAHPSEVA